MSINGYRFYNNGEHYTTCWTNEVAENHISACEDLAKRGFTPYYWNDPDTGEEVLVYSDSFKLEKLTKNKAEVITPENIGTLSKPLRKALSGFEYDGEEWKVKR